MNLNLHLSVFGVFIALKIVVYVNKMPENKIILSIQSFCSVKIFYTQESNNFFLVWESPVHIS